MEKQILDAISELSLLKEDVGDAWIAEYYPKGIQHDNQFVVFLKPEVTAIRDDVAVSDVIKIVFDTLASWSIQIGAVRVLNAKYLEKYHIMDEHYGVINNISRNGLAALSKDALDKFQELFSLELRNDAVVCGGHQLLQMEPGLSALALSVMCDNIGTNKLAAGSYCLNLKIKGRPYLILNAFHPYQLEHFTSPGRVIVAMECVSTTPWEKLRGYVAGATNPVNANEGSIRKTLLERKESLRITDVSQGSNGIHLSAGPLEGMVEVRRFFSCAGKEELSLLDTNFGRLLLEASLPSESIVKLMSNCSVKVQGRLTPAFDLTEDTDAVTALEKLRNAEFQ